MNNKKGNKNEGKNEPVASGKQFTSEYQPSPEAKKKGWERRREAQKIMDKIMELADMSYSEIKVLLQDITDNPDKHTLREVKLANYLMEKKYTIDYLDRHISKAPTEIKGEIKAFTVNDMRKLFNKNPDSKPEEYKEDE
jgi:hypothetical protein